MENQGACSSKRWTSQRDLPRITMIGPRGSCGRSNGTGLLRAARSASSRCRAVKLAGFSAGLLACYSSVGFLGAGRQSGNRPRGTPGLAWGW